MGSGAPADLAGQLGKSTSESSTRPDSAESVSKAQKQTLLDSAPKVHWESSPLNTTDTAHKAGLRRSPCLKSFAMCRMLGLVHGTQHAVIWEI